MTHNKRREDHKSVIKDEIKRVCGQWRSRGCVLRSDQRAR